MLDTLTEVRAPSTRRLYALKWGVFVKWCGQAHIDPVTCTVSDVLSFLQYRLDSGSLPSTLKVYVAAIAAFRSPQGEQSIGKHAMVVRFLKGAKRLHPPRPPSVLPWDLKVVLRAISQSPFEPLTSVGLKDLYLKTTLLLALASAKRIGDLHAFSVDSDCIRFGPGDYSFTIRPRMGYVMRTGSFFVCPVFWVISLAWRRCSDFGVPLQGFEDLHRPFGQLSTIWPAIRVLQWLCERLGRFKTEALDAIVDAITAAYTSQGLECPLHIRGHSTRAIASSWAWSSGMSIWDICVAAGWSSQNTWCMFCYIFHVCAASHSKLLLCVALLLIWLFCPVLSAASCYS